MHYLVTGGAGFIGSHLCDALLNDGHSLVVLDNFSTGKSENLDNRIQVINGCITKKNIFDDIVKACDGVFHLAAIASVDLSRQEWLRTHEVNVSGFVNLLQAISRLEHKIPVVYASSAAIYGDNEALPLKETETPRPLTAYGADKLGCEHHGTTAALVHGIPNIGLRFFNVYGPRQDPSSPYSGVISIFSDRFAAKSSITIYGDGKQSRDFVYVSDVVAALKAAMDVASEGMPLHHVCNVCTGNSVTLLEALEAFQAVYGYEVEVTHEKARTGDIRHSLGDTNTLQAILAIQATTPFKDGLANLIQGV